MKSATSTRLIERPVIRWAAFVALNAMILGYYGYAFMGPVSSVKASLLPGETTHGHYQIELDCNACHAAISDSETHSSANVLEDSCNRCHADQLEASSDTHPAAKFSDPTNADLLQTLDAQKCLTCHREHVPDQTLEMGLTMPVDYCWHCHQDVGENRSSHEGMAFDSCATAGCHNYHDNRAIYEKYLDAHFGEPDFKEDAMVPARNFAELYASTHPDQASLSLEQADVPDSVVSDWASNDSSAERFDTAVIDWSQTAHAAAGVNCTHCHSGDSDLAANWSDDVDMESCRQCHADQVETFVRGKHGMRLAVGLSPMKPSMARLPMHAAVMAGGIDAHRELTCSACHSGHRFDTQYAAVDACLTCHADSHSMAYPDSAHAQLWQSELNGESPVGSGVTCATCHLPRKQDGDVVTVSHDQNKFLRPNETMAREVCSHCHGLEYSLGALADTSLKNTCYDGAPLERNESVQMAHDYFESRRAKRARRSEK